MVTLSSKRGIALVGRTCHIRRRLLEETSRKLRTRSANDHYHLCRSEEHTSELQSHSDLVCRLLLEKKKKRRKSVFTNGLGIMSHITGRDKASDKINKTLTQQQLHHAAHVTQCETTQVRASPSVFK